MGAKKTRGARPLTEVEAFLMHMADSEKAWPGEPVSPEVLDPAWILGVIRTAWRRVQEAHAKRIHHALYDD